MHRQHFQLQMYRLSSQATLPVAKRSCAECIPEQCPEVGRPGSLPIPSIVAVTNSSPPIALLTPWGNECASERKRICAETNRGRVSGMKYVKDA